MNSTHICITGASSGLGKALAVAYAAPGRTLTLWARDGSRLEKTADLCRVMGATTQTIMQDVRDREATRSKLVELDGALPVDMIFLASGVITGTAPDGEREPLDDVCRTLEVNTLGTINMGACTYELMKRRGQGHIIFVSSIAGLYPLPNSPTYCASKIAVSSYAKGLAAANPVPGIRISCVYPGYLQTPMGDRLRARKPIITAADKAAHIIHNRLEAGKDRIVFPHAAALAVRFLHLLPKRIADYLAARTGYTVEPDRESPLYKTSPDQPRGDRRVEK